jgi:hypothetical protein
MNPDEKDSILKETQKERLNFLEIGGGLKI